MFEEQHLSKPPLKVCLVSLVFTPIQAMDGYIPSVQDAFRKGGLPFYSCKKQSQVMVGIPGPLEIQEMPQWFFHDEQKNQLIVITDRSFSYSISAYEGYDSFLTRFSKYLQLFSDVVNLTTCVMERVGLRYVNGFDTDDWRKYIKQPYVGFTLPDTPWSALQEPNSQLTVTQITTRLKENLFGNLVVQVYRDSKPITMPVGIVCIDNKHPDLSKTKAILDIDHAATPGRTFRLNEMQQLLGVLHEVSNTLFFAVTTEAGWTKWK
jgi:uncharacterized protein (TIGR04255 family)